MNGAEVDDKTGSILKDAKVIGVMADGKPCAGFPTPSRKQEFYSRTMVDWGWPEYRIPAYVKSHIHEEKMDREKGDFPLVSTFRLPTLIHSRSGNAKWLTEISNRNPLWMHPKDAARFSVKTGDLVRVNTEIGYFVDKVWVTEGMKPGVVACSHHIGRWRRPQDQAGNRWATNLVSIEQTDGSKWKMRVIDGIRPYKSDDPDSSRIFWSDGGVHQNITFPVHPDPISGMHCWHQKVRVENTKPEDRYGDVFVDTEKAFRVYREWLKMTRPAPVPGAPGLRRPLWLNRPLRPVEETFYLKE
jgi:anaerobic selenocysteine-containing dehydrogenase